MEGINSIRNKTGLGGNDKANSTSLREALSRNKKKYATLDLSDINLNKEIYPNGMISFNNDLTTISTHVKEYFCTGLFLNKEDLRQMRDFSDVDFDIVLTELHKMVKANASYKKCFNDGLNYFSPKIHNSTCSSHSVGENGVFPEKKASIDLSSSSNSCDDFDGEKPAVSKPPSFETVENYLRKAVIGDSDKYDDLDPSLWSFSERRTVFNKDNTCSTGGASDELN